MFSMRFWLLLTGVMLTWSTFIVLYAGASNEHDAAENGIYARARTVRSAPSPPPPGGNSDHAIFHVVLTFQTHGKELCRAIASAMALGYPLPSLLQLESDRTPGYTLLAHIDAKIEAINGFRSGRDDDLMLLMDSSDAWFQLRPQVMLSRYHELKNATVNAQSIVLPGEHSADNGGGDELAELDAAFGTIGALRNLLSQAKDAVVAEPQLDSTYKVFSRIVRNWQNQEAPQTPTGGITSKEFASASRVLFDMSIISSADSKLTKGSTLDATMEELHSARPPFWSMLGGDLAQKASWERRPLRMNSQAGVVPAVVMHNSRDQWVKTWFSRSLVPLWVAQRQMPLGPVAFAGGKYWWPHRHALEWYEIFTKGSRSYMEADDVCAGLLEETLSGR